MYVFYSISYVLLFSPNCTLIIVTEVSCMGFWFKKNEKKLSRYINVVFHYVILSFHWIIKRLVTM